MLVTPVEVSDERDWRPLKVICDMICHFYLLLLSIYLFAYNETARFINSEFSLPPTYTQESALFLLQTLDNFSGPSIPGVSANTRLVYLPCSQ